MRRISLDAIVLIISGLIFISTLVLLVDDELFGRLLLPRPDFKTPRVASVARYIEDTRRRVAEDIAWMPIRSEDPVFDGDTLFTGEASELEIQFLDGVKLSLAPSSLVVVATEDGKTTLDLQLGTFSSENGSNKASSFQVKSAGKVTSIQSAPGTALNYAVSSDGKPALTVLSGSADVRVGSKKAVLSANQKVDIREDGTLSDIKTFSIVLESPENNASLLLESDQEIHFRWTSNQPKSEYRLQLSKEESFKRIAHEAKTGKTSHVLRELAPGPLFWRVVSSDGGESPIGRFSLIQINAPTPAYPVSGQSIEFVTMVSEEELQSPRSISPGLSKDRDEGVLLSWNTQTPSDEFDLELASDPQFQNILWKDSTEERSIKTPGLNAGQYYWRLLSRQEERSPSPWSKPHSFIVVEKLVSEGAINRAPAELELPPIPLPPPKLKNPNLEFEVRHTPTIPAYGKMSFLLRVILSHAVAHAENPRFDWEPVEGASRYRLEVASDRSFGQKTFQIETPDLNATWNEPLVGDFFWQVFTINRVGVAGAPSETGTLKVRVRAPESDEVEFTISKDPDDRHVIDLSWKTNPFAEKYEVEISRSPSFKDAITKRTNDNEIQFKVDSTETHYWRIRSLASNDQPIGRYSAAREVIPDPKVIAEMKAAERQKQEAIEEEKRLALEAEQKKITEAARLAELKRLESEALAAKKAEEARLLAAQDKARRDELERQRQEKEALRLAKEAEERERNAKALEEKMKNGETKPSLASTTQIKGFRRFFPEYTKPQTLVMGIGGAYSNQSFYQTRDNLSPLLDAFPMGAGEGTTFTSFHFDAEFFPHKHIGMGFEGLMNRTSLRFQDAPEAIEANRIDFGFDVRGRYQFFNGLTLVGALGLKRLSQSFIFNDNGVYSLRAPSSLVDSLNLSQSVYVDYLPFASSIMFRLRFDLTQSFKDFPGTVTFTPMIEMRKWWGPFWAGLKYYNQQRELQVQIETPSETSNGRVSENTHMLFLMIGFGF